MTSDHVVEDPVPEDLVADLGGAVAASGLAVAQVDLASLRIVAVSGPAADLLGANVNELLGQSVAGFVADEPTGGLPLLATGRLDGFEAPRRLRRTDGTIVDVYVWAHVVGQARPARYAAFFLTTDAAPRLGDLSVLAEDLRVLGTVDCEWRVDRISSEAVGLLGRTPAEVAGTSMLPLVHPNDFGVLLTGLTHVHETNRDSIVRLRVRSPHEKWTWCRARLASLVDPPRFAFTLRPLRREPGPDGLRSDDLAARLTQLAHEVRAGGLRGPSGKIPTLAELPALATLTAREWEVLTALVEGARVPTIAKTLGLNASTVRNHLSAIYGKVGVSSQTELLSLLRSKHA
jgi:DNA-binding CsgD family transcriptional regulator